MIAYQQQRKAQTCEGYHDVSCPVILSVQPCYLGFLVIDCGVVIVIVNTWSDYHDSSFPVMLLFSPVILDSWFRIQRQWPLGVDSTFHVNKGKLGRKATTSYKSRFFLTFSLCYDDKLINRYFQKAVHILLSGGRSLHVDSTKQ